MRYTAATIFSFGLGVILATACEPVRDAELLRVHAVQPDWVEPGTRVQVEGEGFPAGRETAIRLVGVVHRPGARPLEVDVHTTGRAVSAERVTFRATERWVAELGGRGTFEGDVRVELDAAGDMGTVSGSLSRVRLDVSPATSSRLASEVKLTRRAEAWLDRVGMRVGEDGQGPGLPVLAVEADGAAATSGIRAGDRVLAASTVRPVSIADLAPRADAMAVQLAIGRPARVEPFDVRLPGAVRPPEVPAPVPWVLALLTCLLGFTGPTARPVVRAVRRAAGRLARIRPVLPRRALLWTACMVPAAALVALGWAGGVVAVAALLACVLAAALLRAPRGETGRHALRKLMEGLVVVSAVGVAALLDDGRAGWLGDWPPVLTHPVRFVAFLCASYAAWGAPERPWRDAAGWLEELGRAIAAVMLVCAFLGEGGGGPLAAALSVAAQALLLLVLAALVLPGRPVGVPVRLSLPAAVVPPALGLLWIWVAPPAWAASAWAPGLLMFVTLAVAASVVLGLGARWKGWSPPPLRLHPFL